VETFKFSNLINNHLFILIFNIMKNMKIIFTIAIVIYFTCFAFSQGNVGINNDNSSPDASAMLDVKSTSKGLLIPRMTTVQKNLISSPANGLLVFDSDTNSFWFFNANTSSWVELKPDVPLSAGPGISIAGATISNTGDINPADDITTATNAGGDLSGTFSNLQIAANAVTSAEILDGSVSGSEIADNAVTNAKINDDAITHSKIMNNSISSAKIIDDAILSTDIMTGAVNTSDLADNAVTNTKIMNDAITSSKIQDHAITGTDIAVDAISGANIANDAINGAEIATGAVNTSELADNAVTNEKISDNAVGNAEMADNAIGSAEIQLDAITSADIATGAVTSSEILDGTVGTADLADNTVTNAKMADNSIGSAEIINASVTAADMTSGAATIGQVLTASGAGAAAWSTPSVQKAIADTDNDTKIQVEKNPDEDIIRFDIGGYEKMALRSNSSGVSRIDLFNVSESTGVGAYNLNYNQVTGTRNSAFGMYAMYGNTTGYDNTASGYKSLNANNTGYRNTALGSEALISHLSGYDNNAIGSRALYTNTTGNSNVADGASSLYNSTSGSGNTAIGFRAQYNNTTGNNNTSIGYESYSSNSTGSYNTAIGYFAGFGAANLENTTAIGNDAGGVNNTSNRVEIGNTSVSWIGGQVAWSTYSDARIKENVKENVPGIDFIIKLRPVTYNLNIHNQNELISKPDTPSWPTKYDIENIQMTGFIAQEVEQATLATGFDFSGIEKPANENGLYSLRYSDFVVPLVKAVQEQQIIIQNQQTKVDRLEEELKKYRDLEDRIKTLEAR
jgi:hypothetical protein